MDEYLIELIGRMTVKEEMISSYQSIRWAAHREAEELDKVEYLSQLKLFVEDNPQKSKKANRNAAYFIMAKLLIKNPSEIYINFLLNRLYIETDKYVLSSLLDRLADIKFPDEINVDPIVLCTKSDKWLIRHSAIYALRASHTSLARQTAISFLKSEDVKRDSNEITYANATLSHIGCLEDIQYIKPFTKVRISDVRVSAENAIEEIEKRGI